MNWIETTLAWAQLGLLVPLTLFGLHRGWMVWLWCRTRRVASPTAPTPTEWPRVTVQLPIYNERYVAARLVERVAELDYPRDRLEIQVLDDSTDDTSEIVARAIAKLPARAPVVEHVRRGDRHGFKAGALAAGMQRTDGEFLAVFDADFLPRDDFLRRTIPHFADPGVGMVQSRWEHLNRDYSLLTRVQAILLDGHFLVEHIARSRSGCYFNFNGTAGVFRRACIDGAGGWQHDTLTEDMDLSYRAQLANWRFLYLPEVGSPAELPVDTSAFLIQQHRWAKGAVQTGRKLLGRILRAPIGVVAKGEAVFHLLGNVAFPLLLALILVATPLQVVRAITGQITTAVAAIEGLPVLTAMLCVLIYYGIGQRGAGQRGLAAFARVALLVPLGAGLCVNGTAAVLSAFRREPGEFRRTPKHAIVAGRRPGDTFLYRSRRGWLPLAEVLVGLCALTTSVLAFSIGLPWTGIFHGMFAGGLLWMGVGSMRPAVRVGGVQPTGLELSSASS